MGFDPGLEEESRKNIVFNLSIYLVPLTQPTTMRALPISFIIGMKESQRYQLEIEWSRCMYSHNEILYCIVVPPGPSRSSRIARSQQLECLIIKDKLPFKSAT